MQLVETQRPARPVPEDLPPYFEYEELLNDTEQPQQEAEPTESASKSNEAPLDPSP